MTASALLVLVLLVATFAVLVTQAVRIEVAALGIIVVLAVSGVLPPEEALSGFSSPATLTVVAMLVLSAALERAGVVDYVSRRLARVGDGSERRLLVVLGIPTAAFSAFMNNTPVVALMIPVALSLARRFSVPASKLLIPVSYFSILAGTCTLIGTSTNILVDSLYRAAGGPGFGMFEFGLLGGVYLLAGAALVLLLGPRVLPHRTALNELLAATSPGKFITEVVLRASSRLVGKQLGEAFDAASDVQVLEIVRDEQPMLRPAKDTVLAEGDVLLIESDARTIHSLLASRGVEHGTAVADDLRIEISRVDLRIAEAVVTPNSRFAGSKVRGLGLYRKHGVQILAIRRLGHHHQTQLREWRLQAGDVLLVQGEPEPLRLLQEDGDILLVEGVERELTFPSKAPIAIGILALVVLLAALGVAPIVFLALAGVALAFVCGVLDMRQAIRAVDPEVLLLLAGTIPLGRAMESTGLAASAAAWVVGATAGFAPWAVIGVFYALTSLLTEVVSNNAAAVLLTPIALGVASQLGIDPRPLLVAVAFGASASFATPIGYQTNTLVMGPGGYRFSDFLRIGAPMNLLLAIVATVVIPLVWRP